MGRSNFSKHLYGLFIFICIICALLTSLAGKAMAQATAWSEAMGLTAQRYDHTATLLTNGQVLVAGGWYDPTFPLAESEIYDPNTGTGGTWTATTASLNIGRAYHTATLLANGPASTNGMVLVVGGQDISNNAISITELYNPASGPTTGTWTETSAGLATGRYYHTATLLNNGNVLVTGGVDTNGNVLQSSEIFNPSTSTWSPGPNLNTARYNHEASLLSNGNVLVSGGQDINGNALSSCEIYNPSTSAWTKTGNLTTPRYYHTATSLNINQVLAAGGWDASSDILATSETYNPSTGTWTAAGPLALARIAHTATLLSGGKVLVAGGIGNQTSGNQSLEISDSEVYDPSTRSWTVTGNLVTARSDHTATLLNNGNVLVAGGLGETGTTFSELTDCELYNSTVVASVPGVPQSVTAAPRQRPGNGKLHCPGFKRRKLYYRLHRDIQRWTESHGVGDGHLDNRYGPYQRQFLYFHGNGHQRQWDRSSLAAIQRRDACRGSRYTDECIGNARQRPGNGQFHGALLQRRRRHDLHRDIQRRTDSFRDGNFDNGDGPYQRHCLYFHGNGYQLVRDRSALGSLQQRDACGPPGCSDYRIGNARQRPGNGQLHSARLPTAEAPLPATPLHPAEARRPQVPTATSLT